LNLALAWIISCVLGFCLKIIEEGKQVFRWKQVEFFLYSLSKTPSSQNFFKKIIKQKISGVAGGVVRLA
jgi:hypothetical protein